RAIALERSLNGRFLCRSCSPRRPLPGRRPFPEAALADEARFGAKPRREATRIYWMSLLGRKEIPMHRLLLPVVLVAVAFPIAAQGSNGASKLSGVTGPGFTITLKNGTTFVKTLKAGTYPLVVADKSSIHNFHLFGPGVNKKTSVPFTGTQTW